VIRGIGSICSETRSNNDVDMYNGFDGKSRRLQESQARQLTLLVFVAFEQHYIAL
jgi:hypothetical protein